MWTPSRLSLTLDGKAVTRYRGPTDEDAYSIARARNNQGALISSRRVSLWPEDYHEGYAEIQAPAIPKVVAP